MQPDFTDQTLVDVMEYLAALDRLVDQLDCDCPTCRLVIAALPPVYVLSSGTELMSLDTLAAVSPGLPPLQWDDTLGWKQAEVH